MEGKEDKYYHTKDSVEEYIRLARDVNGRNLIEELKVYLSPGSQLLELGSGPGTDWEILSADYDVTGSDNSIQFLEHLNKSYPSGKFLNLDAVTLQTDLRFDGIYSNKVMHHLTDEELEKSISGQKRILKSGGVICHSFWKGEGSEIFKGMFVNYHNESSIHEYFGKDFEVLLLEEYEEFEEGDSLLLIGRKR